MYTAGDKVFWQERTWKVKYLLGDDKMKLQPCPLPRGYSNTMDVVVLASSVTEEPVKVPEPTSVQLAIASDPSLFEKIVEHFKATGRIEISCQPSRIESEADRLSQVTSLSVTEAVAYIKPTTEASHSAKFDIIVSDDIPEALQQFIGTFFKKGLRSGTKEFQINSRSLAEYLMQKHNILPIRFAPEVCAVLQ